MPKIIYIPPDTDITEKVAIKTCKAVAKQKNDQSYRDYEVMMGMAEFLNIVAEIKAKQANKQNQIAEEKQVA